MAMPSSDISVFRRLHTWVGLIAGMVLFVAFYAGVITLFRGEVTQWQQPELRAQATASPAEYQVWLDRFIALHPQARDEFWMILPGEYEAQLRFMWMEAGKHGRQMVTQSELQSGEDEKQETSELAHLINEVHFSLAIPGMTGRTFLGVISLLYGLALVTGIVIHLPRLTKDFWLLRKQQGERRHWLDLHNLIGVISLPFHLIFAWTGAIWGLSALLYALFNSAIFDQQLYAATGQTFMPMSNVQRTGVVQAALPADLLLRKLPNTAEFTPKWLHYKNYGDSSAQVEIVAQQEKQLSQSKLVVLNATTGQLVQDQTGDNESLNHGMMMGLYSLHFGDFGGIAIRLLYAVLGIGGCFLFYSGNQLWINSQLKNRQLKIQRQGIAMAKLTNGFCIGCCIAISSLFVFSALMAEHPNIAMLQTKAFLIVWGITMLYSFLRPIAQGRSELLYGCAGITFLIPLVDLWVNHNQLFAGFITLKTAFLWVDLAALLYALVFWRLAQRATRYVMDFSGNIARC
ncbi:PepSY-associated TM helix domain-containing protein [uncultured Tolumonas sp.]|uniref:PepSY-associated TM helix domain-containing protein n=1 Tax=uncultured Tolumonas sp. TaxID=263765 RepID=UPI002A0A81EF|nr:PepSY-associated TM helix domain-containing protein [uncultured Tolumonas sp.]